MFEITVYYNEEPLGLKCFRIIPKVFGIKVLGNGLIPYQIKWTRIYCLSVIPLLIVKRYSNVGCLFVQ